MVKGITIHNTGNGKSASELFSYMRESHLLYLTHYLVDEKEIIQTIPLDTNAFHTGKGYDYGNTNTIAIEICRSTCDEELYLKAQANAINLIKELMATYNLSDKDIYFHKDFDFLMNCPHRIISIYKNKQNFIKGVL